MADLFTEFHTTIKKHRAQGWGWRYDGLEDWPTDQIISQLRELGIDTDAERFAQQAATVDGFKALDDEWNRQMRDEFKGKGFWEDFPLVGIPVLWERLAPHVICADLIEEHLYHVVKAEEEGETLPDVEGMPADLAAAMKLAQFLENVEPAQRSARFAQVNEGRYYDYLGWLSDCIENHGAKHPDAVTRLADLICDCNERERGRLQADLAIALAVAGRRDEAVARARANIDRFPDDIWVRILAGDVFDEVGDEPEAMRLWLAALPMANESFDWEGAFERLEGACERAGRQGELEEISRAHPRPVPKVLPSSSTPDSFDPMSASRFDADADWMPPLGQPQQLTRASVVGRNDPCPCGSGKKYKKCCLR